MAKHHPLGIAYGPRSVDDHSTLIGLLALHDLVQLGLGDAIAKLHEIIPLWKEKTSEDLNRHFSKEDTKDGQEAHEKMLNITNYGRNANQNYNEVSPHTGQNGHHQKVYKP